MVKTVGLSVRMHDFFQPGRPATLARDAMIATSHPLATAEGLAVLAEGGNAVDAAIAASATLCVVEAHMTGIGGDCFVLYAPKDKPVKALNGSGRAPAATSVERLRELGFDAIPRQSAHAVTIPGAVAAWTKLHAEHGTLPLERLFRKAIDYAEIGYPVTPRVAQDWAADRDLIAASHAAGTFLAGGRMPTAGDRHVQPALGARLREIARHGAEAFYAGKTAERLVNFLRAEGGLHTQEDFHEAMNGADWVEPISTRYRGHDIYECPPNGQGVAALLILNILSQARPPRPLSRADWIHLHAEATRIAYHHRDILLGDPQTMTTPVAELLSPGNAARLAATVDFDRAGAPVLWTETEHTDTIYLCAVDRDGNAISFINSIFNPFGSTLMAPETGILLHNRGQSFNLVEGHPNAIGSRKRPLHTIIPGIIRRDGRNVGPFGVMGGHYQAAGHGAFLDLLLGQGLDVQGALSAPRSFAFNGVLEVETTLNPAILRDLAGRGHRIAERQSPLGGGQAICIDEERGVLQGGSDHRKDGCALGF